MSKKSKGINAERDLIHKYWEKKWGCVRVAGSGAIGYPCPDIVAGNKLRKVAIECKITKKEKKYFPKSEIKQLKNFCHYYGSEPWIAVKFFRSQWYFLNLEDLRETKKSFVISKEQAKLKGLSLDEFLGEDFN